jgi:hypothetical protein
VGSQQQIHPQRDRACGRGDAVRFERHGGQHAEHDDDAAVGSGWRSSSDERGKSVSRHWPFPTALLTL